MSGISRGKAKKRKIIGFFKKVYAMKYVPVFFFSRILLQKYSFLAGATFEHKNIYTIKHIYPRSVLVPRGNGKS